ncbi:hypothetical protein M501DRAFT_211401 [Patellaria atrata CBS 101060]|uniref:WD40 repeat-like protein n=1 Tax=Patellaria atrata CBS 101060 TaxID=1346257 RepID=A0A9P4S860_9PEZI|nr:hypothetical protein M501DRAFT_211401 [Patellaria atrata CBS 101060]
MGYIGEIAGHYYDEEQDRYFKIQSSGLATPNQSKYVLDEVLKVKRAREKRKLQDEFVAQQQISTVKRAQHLRPTTATTAALAHEQDCYSKPSPRKLAYVSSFSASLKTFPRYVTKNSLVRLEGFAHDELTDAVFLALSTTIPRNHYWVACDTAHQFAVNSPRWTSHLVRTELQYFVKRKDQVDFSPSTGTLILSGGGGAGSEIYLTHLSESDRMRPNFDLWQASIATLLRPDVSSIRSLAVNPFRTTNSSYASTEKIIAGASDCLLSITSTGYGTWDTSRSIRTHSDVMAVSWLAEEIAMAGCRDGTIFLWDSRSQGHHPRIHHRSVISSLKRGDNESRIVVCGLENSLDMYDLRMMKHLQPNQSSRKKSKKGIYPLPKEPATEPYLSFDYDNNTARSLGMDVCGELGLVAAADQNGFIQIYSLQSGEAVRSVAVGTKDDRHCSSLRWVRDKQSGWKIMCNDDSSVYNLEW